MAKPTPEALQIFQQNIAVFTPISPETLNQLLKHSEINHVFIGKASCSYCRRFAPKLSKVATETHISIYFADNGSQLTFNDFRAQHNIPTVPALLKISHGQLIAVCRSTISEAEIKTFLQSTNS